jgi:uncharacterized protein with ParB-like and HNH nuclease domain
MNGFDRVFVLIERDDQREESSSEEFDKLEENCIGTYENREEAEDLFNDIVSRYC